MKTLITLLCALGTLGAQVQPDGGSTDVAWRQGGAVDISWRNHIEANWLDIEMWDAAKQRSTVLARRVPARLGAYATILSDTVNVGDHYVLVLRNADKLWQRMHSTGYLRIAPKLQQLSTSVQDNAGANAITVAPNPTSASALVSWDGMGVRKVRVVGIDGDVRLERDVESTESRMVLPSDRWVSGTYAIELIGAAGVIARSMIVVVH